MDEKTAGAFKQYCESIEVRLRDGHDLYSMRAWASKLPQLIDVVYSLNLNEWNGNKSLQLMVQDLRPSAV